MITRIEIVTAINGCGNYCPNLAITRGPDINIGDGEIMPTFYCANVDTCIQIKGAFEKANNDGKGISESI